MIDQVVGTALLMTMVLAVGDKRNLAPDPKMAPLIVGLTVLGIGLAFGSNAGYAINPARDFGPRLLAFAAGWHDVFSASNYYFWIPIVGPILGAAVGAFFYDLIVHDRHPGGGDRE
jgi:glycerol uptake facilitator protein